MKDKQYFISQYDEIHENLSFLEREIESHLANKTIISENDQILDDLKMRTKNEIERLEKTRKYEREIFNY